MEKSTSASGGLKDHFVVRRRLNPEDDGRKRNFKSAKGSLKVISSPAKGQSNVFKSPIHRSSKSSTGLSTTSPSKRTRENSSLSADQGPKLERFNYIEFDSPTKKEKRSPSAVGADLPLPKSYQCLAEQFRCTDVIVDMLRRRQETCTFKKLKNAVEEMSGRAFTVTTLAQMKTVYPRAFTHYYDSNIPGDHVNRSKYQLVVEANMEERALDFSSTPGKMAHFTSTTFIHRRRIFNRNLLSLVKGHHRTFLAGLDPPLDIADRDVFRWHEDFDLDSVPDVEEAALPTPPVKETLPSAKHFLLKHVMSKQSKAANQSSSGQLTLKDTMQKKDESKTSEKGTPDKTEDGVDAHHKMSPSIKRMPPSTPDDTGHLQGVSKKLIEKIREKEAARARLEITRGPGETKELRMLDTSMKMVPVLKSYFLLEKKAAVPLYDVVAKVQESLSSQLSQDFVEETLNYLVKSGVSWIQIVSIKTKKYVKVDRATDVNLVLKKISELKKQHYK